MQNESGFLPWALNYWTCKHCTWHYSWKTGLSSRSLLPASVANLKPQLHMLLFLLGLLLICIIIRKLLPIPNEQRGFKHLPSRENRWFISLTGRKDWHMLSILYPLLWSYKASSIGKDHWEKNAFLCSPFPPNRNHLILPYSINKAACVQLRRAVQRCEMYNWSQPQKEWLRLG